MEKRPPICPSCGSGEVRKSSAIVSQGEMRLQGRTTGLGINSGGVLSGQVGAIAATISSDVIERNKLSLVPSGYEPPNAGCVAFIVAGPVIFIIVLLFSSVVDSISMPSLSVRVLFSFIFTGVIGFFWIRHSRDNRTPAQKEEDSRKFGEMMKAHKENYDSQWYCFQCGTIFRQPTDTIDN